jgi:hypothetical protein
MDWVTKAREKASSALSDLDATVATSRASLSGIAGAAPSLGTGLAQLGDAAAAARAAAQAGAGVRASLGTAAKSATAWLDEHGDEVRGRAGRVHLCEGRAVAGA